MFVYYFSCPFIPYVGILFTSQIRLCCRSIDLQSKAILLLSDMKQCGHLVSDDSADVERGQLCFVKPSTDATDREEQSRDRHFDLFIFAIAYFLWKNTVSPLSLSMLQKNTDASMHLDWLTLTYSSVVGCVFVWGSIPCGHNGAVKADRLRTMQLVWIQWEYISQRARSLMFWYFSRNSV